MNSAPHSRLSAAAATLAAAAALVAAMALSGCEVDSSNTSREVSNASGTVYDFSGLYKGVGTNDANGVTSLVYPSEKQSGTTLAWMRILQDGSSLQAYDNAGKNWNGSISGVEDTIARFSLEGSTTAGAAVTIAGTMTYASGQSTINASWLESGFSGNFFAVATVSPPTTNTGSVAVSPTSATISSGNSQTFTASGGNGTYSWSHTGSCGTLSDTSGSSVTYTYSSSGTDTLTVTSGGKSASASITCE